MNITDWCAAGQQLINFNRMLIIVGIGLMTILLDGSHMKKMGLKRESLWAKVMGLTVILGGIGGWIALKIWG